MIDNELIPAVEKIVSDAEAQLKHLYGHKVEVRIRIPDEFLRNHNALLLTICEHFNLSVNDVCSKNRKREIASARFLYFYFSIYFFGKSASFLAREFKIHHTSVLNGKNKIKDLISVNDAEILRAVAFIQSKISKTCNR